MKLRIVILITLLISCYAVFSQKKNDKKYKDGYIIRFSDTISCRIYTGYQANEIGYEVTFKYSDDRIITYNPGSVIKGFGYKTDTGMVHYYQIPIPEYWINEQKNNKAYAEVISAGQLTLYKFTKIKNSSFVIPVIAGPVIGFIVSNKKENNYFLKIGASDSLISIGHQNAIGAEYFERNEILEFVKQRPQVLANTPADKFIYIKELRSIFNNYNSWYKKHQEELNNETHQ
jgi:hypothetical protein